MKKLVVASLLLVCSALSRAAPTLVLSFTQPTASTIGPHESIPLWVTASVPTGQPDFVFNPNAGAPWGFSPSEMPTIGFDSTYTYRTFTSYTGASIGFGVECTDLAATTLTCATPYGFAEGPGFQSIADANGVVHIGAGTSVSLLAGTYIPSWEGGVPGQTYTLYNASLALIIKGKGLDGQGNSVDIMDISFYYRTCPSLDASCTFTRTISAVPEPASWAIFTLGLGGLAWRLRRRA